MTRILTLLAFFALGFAAPSSAQMAGPACDGNLTVVRISQIKPTSNMAAFMKAMDAHLAWYRKNGFTDNQIYAARIAVADPATKATKYSETEVMTFHVGSPATMSAVGVSKKDQAGWDNYVKQYRDSSDIKSETVVCLPKNR